MRMLTQRIEFGGSAQACGAVLLVAAILLTTQTLCAERNTAHQTGNLSGEGGRAGSPKGIPPHAPGYLGILFQNLSDEQVSSMHLKGGVEVVMVDHDGPAGKAGLQVNDLIVRMNGQVVPGADALRRMIHDAGVGAAVTFGVVRAGKQVTLNAQLAYRGEVEREAMARMALPDAAGGDDDPVVGGFVESYEVEPVAPPSSGHGPGFLLQMLHTTPFTGLMVEAMAPQLAGFFGSTTGGGLLVQTVAANSPAAAAGLHAGDVIERADSIPVKSTSAWVKRLHASKGQAIELVVLRDKHELHMTLIPQLKRHSQVKWLVLFGDKPDQPAFA
jgi:serine protease Do